MRVLKTSGASNDRGSHPRKGSIDADGCMRVEGHSLAAHIKADDRHKWSQYSEARLAPHFTHPTTLTPPLITSLPSGARHVEWAGPHEVRRAHVMTLVLLSLFIHNIILLFIN